MSVGVAFKAFFAALFQREAAERIRAALADEPSQKKLPTGTAVEAPQAPASKPATTVTRSEALTLLSTLQREARLLDLVHESLDEFDDAQIGAAAREVIRDCRKSLDRMFAIAPLSESNEGQAIDVPKSASPNQIRLVGASSGRGTVVHRGWKATMCEVPSWKGGRNENWILAPVEVEMS